jgi:FlaA1/EpsC-like NDP-sugar epimerase
MSPTQSRLLNLPRRSKQALAMLTDISLCVITVWLAICLRFESWVVLQDWQWLPVLLSPVIAIPIFVRFGLYRAIFRYAGQQTVLAIIRAHLLYALIFMALFTVTGFSLVPRTIGLIQPVLLLVGVSATRLLAQQWLMGLNDTDEDGDRPLERVLIYGADRTGQQLASSLPTQTLFQAVGFVDDNPQLAGGQIQGLTVYSPSQLAAICQQHHVQHVLLAMPSLSRTRRNEVLQQLSHLPVSIRTLPSLDQMVGNAAKNADASQLRELNIEDLLGRDPVPPIESLLQRNILGRVVMVTGAGGSIGSEICRQILAQQPSKLLLVDSSEFALYSIHAELSTTLSTKQINSALIPALIDITRTELLDAFMAEHRPSTIMHAAAYKHVPLVEENIQAAVHNNVSGTYSITSLALRHGCEHFTLISTDKAVRPTNIMGATKRVAELVTHLAQREAIEKNKPCRFSMVRFGNVLASSGSVIPKFKEQIAAGGPVTVTHPEITRYFMTIPEAAQLVIQANAMASDTRSNVADLFLLDMGEPVKIIDLAKTMIKLSGFNSRSDINTSSASDIQITFSGLRPGEKLYEELLVDGRALATIHPRIWRADEALDPVLGEHSKNRVVELLNLPPHLSHAFRNGLQALVPDFRPASSGT